MSRPPSGPADPYGQLLGVEVVEVGDGSATIALTTGQQHTNFLGVVRLPERELVAVAQGQVSQAAGERG